MRAQHVGFLIVHREGDTLQKPVHVLTDRDLVLGVMARDVDPHAVTVDDIVSLSRQTRATILVTLTQRFAQDWRRSLMP